MSNANLVKGADGAAGFSIEPRAQSEPWHDAEWQRLWLAVEPRTWGSLALVPAGEGAPIDFTLVVAVTLSRTGMVHVGAPLQVADATRVSLSQLTAFCNEVKQCTRSGQRVLVAVPPVTDSAVTASIVQAMDAAVLCVLANKMTSAQSQRTIKLVGQARFLGSAIFHPHHFSTSAPNR